MSMGNVAKSLAKLRGSVGTTRVILIAVSFVAVGLTALMPVVANPRTGPREIVLVAHDMAFYLEGSKVPNPAIVLKASEEVRIVVKNQDIGITHGFAVTSMRAAMDRIEPGSTERTRLRAPAIPGRYEYVCPPHAQMMKGLLLVEK